jgi:hypothetical protein
MLGRDYVTTNEEISRSFLIDFVLISFVLKREHGVYSWVTNHDLIALTG